MAIVLINAAYTAFPNINLTILNASFTSGSSIDSSNSGIEFAISCDISSTLDLNFAIFSSVNSS